MLQNEPFLHAVFKEAKNNRLGWPVPLLKRIFSSAVTKKHNLVKGIILSWDDYAHNTVSDFLLCFMFYVTILLPTNLYFIQECMWTHHWVILQFVNPLFSVPTHYNLCQVGPNGVIILSSNIAIGISLSVASTMSWNSSITTVMGRYHLLVWSGLEHVLMSKAGVWISIRLRKQ